MKRIILCLDGTWNQVLDPDTVTNVVKLAQSIRTIASDGTQQIVYYNSGVGTGDLFDKFLGGVFGRGLRNNVKRAYAFLSLNYEPGDEIYIFGFSRGAYTARALSGVIGASGILQKDEYQNFEVAWNFYRQPKTIREAAKRHDMRHLVGDPYRSLPEKRKHIVDILRTAVPDTVVQYAAMAAKGKFCTEARVRCVGVWDTVGSYGIPAGFGLGALSRFFTAWLLRGFHDTEISKQVDIGLHAVALDEKRRPFAPTLWTAPKDAPPSAHVEQVWFVGVHANIGGGYLDPQLADIPLIWMMARVTEIGREKFQSGLEFDPKSIGEKLQPSPLGTLYRSERFWPISRIFPYIRPVLAPNDIEVRAIRWNGENPNETHVNEMIHWSVFKRLGQAAPLDGKGDVEYWPKNLDGLGIPEERIAKRTPEEKRLTGIHA